MFVDMLPRKNNDDFKRKWNASWQAHANLAHLNHLDAVQPENLRIVNILILSNQESHLGLLVELRASFGCGGIRPAREWLHGEWCCESDDAEPHCSLSLSLPLSICVYMYIHKYMM